MKVLIVTADSNGAYPVPAAKGGAVATLIEYLADENNEKELCDLQILSYYDSKAYEMSGKYPNVEFLWVRIPGIIKLLDACVFRLVRIMKNKKAISFKSSFSLLYYILSAKKILKSTDAEKVVLENNIPLAMALKKANYQGQWFYHLHNVPRIDAGCRAVMAKTTKFLCVSQYVADQICGINSAIGHIPREKTDILYNCIDTELFRPIDTDDETLNVLRQKYGLRNKDKVLIFVGRLTEEKGAGIFLEAVSLLPENVKALIVGSYHYNADVRSRYQDKLHRLAHELGDRVIFTGYVQHKNLPFYYNLADIAVLPSIWEEPAGLTNLEAMACGVPVITTDSGGIAEYVGDSVILKRDAALTENIAGAVDELLGDFKRYTELSSYSRKWIKENFSKDNYMKKMLQCIG